MHIHVNAEVYTYTKTKTIRASSPFRSLSMSRVQRHIEALHLHRFSWEFVVRPVVSWIRMEESCGMLLSNYHCDRQLRFFPGKREVGVGQEFPGYIAGAQQPPRSEMSKIPVKPRGPREGMVVEMTLCSFTVFEAQFQVCLAALRLKGACLQRGSQIRSGLTAKNLPKVTKGDPAAQNIRQRHQTTPQSLVFVAAQGFLGAGAESHTHLTYVRSHIHTNARTYIDTYIYLDT